MEAKGWPGGDGVLGSRRLGEVGQVSSRQGEEVAGVVGVVGGGVSTGMRGALRGGLKVG